MRPIVGIVIVGLLAGATGLALWPVQKALPPAAQTQMSAKDTLAGDFTLAVSWHPAFCETARRKPECRDEDPNGFAADHFVLHGLWPDGADAFYCNVPTEIANQDRNGQWRQLPGVELSDRLWNELQKKMPGTQSQLHRHEWIKHGTCSGGSAEEYYDASLALLDVLNASDIQQLFANNVGGRLSTNEIRDAFNAAFGGGAGKRVTVECAREDGRTMIDELRIAISGEITQPANLGQLILSGNTRQRGCPSGEIDRAG